MSARTFAPEFFAPLPFGAVLLLVLNDHALKFEFPGSVTGKLSDIAGCFVLPLFLSALLALLTRAPARRRICAGAALTVAFYSTLKLSQPFADATCGAMDVVARVVGSSCGKILADPTDLLALPFACLAAWFGLWRTGRTSAEAAFSGGLT